MASACVSTPTPKLLDYVSMIGFYRLPLDWLERYPQQVAAVDVAAVRAAWQRRIRPEQLVTVIAGGDGDRPAAAGCVRHAPRKPRSEPGPHRRRTVALAPARRGRGAGLRPTPDRVRETLFNWLGQDLDGQACLPGPLRRHRHPRLRGGLTRRRERRPGRARRARSTLHKAAKTLQAAQVEIVRGDAVRFAQSTPQRFDGVFLDPPYKQGWIEQVSPGWTGWSVPRDGSMSNPKSPWTASAHGARSSRAAPAGPFPSHAQERGMKEAIAVYPGTFDPFHPRPRGSRAARLDPVREGRRRGRAQQQQEPDLRTEDRSTSHAMPSQPSQRRSGRFDCLLMEFLQQQDARVIIRGLRAVSDFEYEFQMAGMNRKLYPDVETVFLTPGEEFMFISATMVGRSPPGGDVSKFVQPRVLARLQERLKSK